MTSNDLDCLTIALPKGKLFPPAVSLLKKIGYTASELDQKSRKLVILNDCDEGTQEIKAGKCRFIITKTADLPTYVEYGAADIGIIGKDVLLEEKRNVYELLDLKFGFCRLMVAVPEKLKREKITDYAYLRVATKYPNIAENFFQSLGIQVEIIKLNGSIELAPMVGIAEMIVDIVETGTTLRENKLLEIAQIQPSTARLIANRVSFKMKSPQINRMLEQLTLLIKDEGEVK